MSRPGRYAALLIESSACWLVQRKRSSITNRMTAPPTLSSTTTGNSWARGHEPDSTNPLPPTRCLFILANSIVELRLASGTNTACPAATDRSINGASPSPGRSNTSIAVGSASADTSSMGLSLAQRTSRSDSARALVTKSGSARAPAPSNILAASRRPRLKSCRISMSTVGCQGVTGALSMRSSISAALRPAYAPTPLLIKRLTCSGELVSRRCRSSPTSCDVTGLTRRTSEVSRSTSTAAPPSKSRPSDRTVPRHFPRA